MKKLTTLEDLWESITEMPSDDLKRFYADINEPKILICKTSSANVPLVEIPSGESIRENGEYDICLNPMLFQAMIMAGASDDFTYEEVDEDLSAEALTRLLYECDEIQKAMSDGEMMGELMEIARKDVEYAPTVSFSDLFYLTPMTILLLNDPEIYKMATKCDGAGIKRIEKLTTCAYRYLILRIHKADADNIAKDDDAMSYEVEESAKCISRIIEITRSALERMARNEVSVIEPAINEILDLPIGENYMNG